MHIAVGVKRTRRRLKRGSGQSLTVFAGRPRPLRAHRVGPTLGNMLLRSVL